MKKRILFIENSKSNHSIGGSHKSLYTLINGLDRTKYEPFLLLNQRNPYLKLFDSLEIPVYYIEHQKWDTRDVPSEGDGNGMSRKGPSPTDTIKSFFGILFRIGKDVIPMTLRTMGFIRRLKIDVIHTNTRIGSNQHGILAGWITSTPVICHERWWTPDSWLNRRLVNVPKMIICVSKAIKANVLEIGSVESKCRVIYNGRELPAISECGDKYKSIADKKFTIGFMSNISEYKGHTVFVKGAIELMRRYLNMEFHIYGSTEAADAQYLEFLKEIIEDAGFMKAIQFKGYIKEVNEVIQGFHINCCLTIEDEPLSGTIIEGFLNQTVVIATKTGGSPELITHEENGWLIEPDSLDAFVDAVEKLYHNPSLMKKLAENGYDFAVKNLSGQVYVERVEQVYEDLFLDSSAKSPMIHNTFGREDNLL